MSKQAITEESGVHKQWVEEARKQTLDTLPEFLRKLTEDYQHDYGTICHAIAAAAIGAACAVDASPTGGITGFQAGCIMWEFIRHWQHLDGHALRLVDYDDLLYPQYREKFERHTIKRATWDDLVEKAKKLLADQTYAAEVRVVDHWRSIVAGKVPFGVLVEEDAR